ncbi:MAG TPA: sigma-70 family RNA polymerase sigma factor [Chthonomonadaceae bacterium]|nr:sigma-70 family RNA polymerase sigma factor [Chthonomonadaceae bacterium]
MNPTDRSLVRGCLAGDRQAWETLIRRYERLLYRIALSAGLSSEDAADVFQNVCVQLLRSLDKLCDDRHLTGWLITTARREVWRLQRQKQRLTAFPQMDPDDPDSPLAELADEGPLPQETLLRLEQEQIVRAALQELGDLCRTLLTLLYQTEPTPAYAEIARRLQVSEGAIGPYRGRCLQKLKKILQQNGF